MLVDEVVDDLRLLDALRLGLERTGGWKRPKSGWSPPFELKWLAIDEQLWPLNVNSPASGLRLLSKAGLVGIDAARAERRAPARRAR